MKRELRRSVTIVFFVLAPFVMTSCGMDEADNPPDFTAQLQKDLAAIDSYLAANNITAQTDADGLIRYVVHFDSPGTDHPTINGCVTANYKGMLLATGQEFDKGEGVSFPLNAVIDGWKIGIPLLTLGDSATLYVPSGLGYGFYGYPPEIPSNANLIFNVGIAKVGTTYKTSDRSCD